jgi:hypothetical protein
VTATRQLGVLDDLLRESAMGLLAASVEHVVEAEAQADRASEEAIRRGAQPLRGGAGGPRPGRAARAPGGLARRAAPLRQRPSLDGRRPGAALPPCGRAARLAAAGLRGGPHRAREADRGGRPRARAGGPQLAARPGGLADRRPRWRRRRAGRAAGGRAMSASVPRPGRSCLAAGPGAPAGSAATPARERGC